MQRLGLACVAAAFAGFLFKSYAGDKPAADKQQRPDTSLDQPQVKSVGQYYFPNWVFDDPKGDNALVTTSQLESSDKPLYRYTNYFKKFGPSFSKYSGKKTVMRVARTQAEFDDILKTQLLLKNLITEDDWKNMKEYISYDFQKDGHFVELKDAELLRERISTLEQLDQFVGKYYSEAWIRKNVLRQSESEIADIDNEIKQDGAVGLGPSDDLPDPTEWDTET